MRNNAVSTYAALVNCSSPKQVRVQCGCCKFRFRNLHQARAFLAKLDPKKAKAVEALCSELPIVSGAAPKQVCAQPLSAKLPRLTALQISIGQRRASGQRERNAEHIRATSFLSSKGKETKEEARGSGTGDRTISKRTYS